MLIREGKSMVRSFRKPNQYFFVRLSSEAWLPQISQILFLLNFFFFISMGGICSFFIESKLFQLVVEEGGNFFVLRIVERGKYFMKLVFMGKSAALWLMKNIEHTVIGVSPKQFFTLREGDSAYTLQRGSNSFCWFLLVSELKVGGL